jgi:hypothetical protein
VFGHHLQAGGFPRWIVPAILLSSMAFGGPAVFSGFAAFAHVNESGTDGGERGVTAFEPGEQFALDTGMGRPLQLLRLGQSVA